MAKRDPAFAVSEFAPNEAAWGSYNDSVDSIGWGRLEIHTSSAVADDVAARAAGFLEGSLTSHRIWQNAVNNGIPSFSASAAVAQFYDNNFAWMEDMQKLASKEPASSPDRAYWWQVYLTFEQQRGLFEGYKSTAVPGEDTLTPMGLFYLNAVNEVGDVSTGLQAQGQDVGDDAQLSPFAGESAGRCSALIRLLDQNADILISQITWSTLNSMLRIYKLYDFPFHLTNDNASAVVPGVRSGFSSYPGVLFSGDDFYVLSSGLVVQETTIGCDNVELFKEYISAMTVPEYVRNIVANRLAASGREWTGLFALFNSGTYNNMMMVLDYNRFAPGQPLQNDTFYICEQIPGFVRSTDVSQRVQQDRYFGSYNIAYDPMIRELMGIEASVRQYGPWFTYEGHPRALIFKRDHANVVDIDSMKRMMRYNDFKVDPLSSQMPQCSYQNLTDCTPPYSSENTIATRCDLNPINGVYAFGALGHRNHVATDAKISSFSTFDAATCLAHVISGPTTDQQPPFQWSTSDYNATVPHLGMPDYWDFPWVTMSF